MNNSYLKAGSRKDYLQHIFSFLNLVCYWEVIGLLNTVQVSQQFFYHVILEIVIGYQAFKCSCFCNCAYVCFGACVCCKKWTKCVIWLKWCFTDLRGHLDRLGSSWLSSIKLTNEGSRIEMLFQKIVIPECSALCFSLCWLKQVLLNSFFFSFLFPLKVLDVHWHSSDNVHLNDDMCWAVTIE